MAEPISRCPDCDDGGPFFSRRDFLKKTSTGAAAAVAIGSLPPTALAAPSKKPAETYVKLLHDSLSEKQRSAVCFEWDYQQPGRGLLRTRISNNWRITKPAIKSNFFNAEQQQLIRSVFEGMVNPDWVERFDKQFQDDMGGFGKQQSIAIFGEPGSDKFEFVLSGRHGTMRCDGNTTDHICFGAPIVYGHAASGYYEKANHPGNVFWHQAIAANNVFQMLDGKQRRQALLPKAADEALIDFQGADGKFPGVPIGELSGDQREHCQDVLKKLIEPYRQSDRDEVVAALKAQGGLDKCSLAFYRFDDMGEDGVWDNWRIEGPSFVWHYRGAPHVHVWVNIADDPTVTLNSRNDSGPLRK
ncbi:MAG: DUF3500 domain-containing protein [Pirellulales bacterium]